ncbi:MAG TPA: carboxypeptidase-like regulatory domain-containing protein [Thermoanaerobaculia bacterium]|jgi:protocatechuate 3,4-dioxygenase beta subunit|nr:carboxypeptidase-like regulatory domain-containing protein [Thermoanaerobaculia bacterium]
MFPTELRRAAVAGIILIAAAVSPGMADGAATETARSTTASQPAPKASAAQDSSSSEHVALRDAIWRLERLLRRRLNTISRPETRQLPEAGAKTAELRDLADVLRESARKQMTAEGRDLARKAGVLMPLLREVESRERASSVPSSPTSFWEPRQPATVFDAGAAASCASAIDVVDGSYQGEVVRRADGTSGEIWLRYTAKVGGMAVVSTAGSDFDTVVDWFDACPGSSGTPRAHGDDEVGLQGRTVLRVAAGETTWIRTRGWEQATGTATIQIEGGSAGISGTVTNEATAGPLVDRYVEVWNANGSYAGYDYTAGDGSYLVLGLSPGTYYASTQGDFYYPDGFLDELYADIPCAGGAPSGCTPTTGTPIVVQSGAVHTGIDFALGHGASVAGRVRDAATGAALPYADVAVYGANGGLAAMAETDQAGRYLVSGLAGGTAFAVAGDSSNSEYRRELYQDIPCVPSCTMTNGTPIPVADGQTTPGVDFFLDRFGVVAGTVTQVADGAPITYARVDILDAQGSQRSYGYTNAAGQYLAGGLNAGTYYATSQTWSGYLDELYDDVPCEPSCNVAGGTAFSVALDHTTGGIDFALRKLGSISGHLTDAVTGDPLSDYSYVDIYNAAGTYVAYGYSYGGSYSATGLLPGTYYVRASRYYYRSELYDDIPCLGTCDPTTGTPVSVVLDADTNGIDFALTTLGSIAGTVTDASSAPAGGVEVEVWDSSGNFVGYTYSGNTGTYQIYGLVPGNYFVVAESYEFIDELYDDIPCPGGAPTGCNPANGTSVAVSLGAPTAGIDFALVRKGGIAGTVRDAVTSAPLPSSYVWIYNSSGTLVASTYSASNGTYQVNGLDAGNYFAVADSYPYNNQYDAELYNNLPCPSASCNPTAGTPIPVTLGTVTTAIDFGLSQSGVITGLVTDTSGTTPPYVTIYLYNATGQYRGYASTDAGGHYQLPSEPGTWYLVAYGGSELVGQLYSGIRCLGSCDVTTGTPVVVTTGNTTANIDFVLSYARGIDGRVTDHGHPLSGVAIDLWDAAGEHVDSTLTGPQGGYHFVPNPGTYYASTDSGMGALEEVWNNLPCPQGPAYQGLCDPTKGTPIAVASHDALVDGIDFDLESVELFVNGFEAGNRPWSAVTP